ncbi:hypothetical protein GUY44_26260 [Pimelobacter simplex]|uniref:Uncharacterized protein n=1 Tax=Nocardioides simplex TaxID=2045 RepID=A0A0A1DIY0_NOCSI|nr:hypothetical protein [Pimelobacter simplex]AIY16602.1 hypothetical protein KR76_07165 [Pimelobacter simplex]MCG8154006.1 hypothetical protein [Pimelobacter simplex]GEB15413.1 hypothetical protein NSI01_37280 [Pimelobacter simplex]SFN14767.1 hypothetical protein SAMN05421671_5406 [Pimelobacter simplex]
MVDESKASDYLVVATWVSSAKVVSIRRELRSLLRSNQARLHFQKMSHAHRRRAIEVIAGLDVTAVVYRSKVRDPREARAELIGAVLEEARATAAQRVVVERDDAAVALDAAVARQLRSEVIHLRAVEEPLLWLSDATAWCVHRSGDWRTAVAPIIRDGTLPKRSEPG